jgi:hypothetical protein
MQILNKSGVCTLEIFNAKLEDAGTYVCSAVNDHGKAQTKCKITVQKRAHKAVSDENALTHSPSYSRLSTTPSSSSASLLTRSATTVDVRHKMTSPNLRSNSPMSQFATVFKKKY